MPGEFITEAPISQVLDGHRLGEPGTVQCMNGECQQKLHDGHQITIYTSQSGGGTEWVITGVYCAGDCEPEPSNHQTDAQTDVIARAWLGVISLAATQVSLLCVTDVKVVG